MLCNSRNNYRPPTKLRESNVFSRVCLFTMGSYGTITYNALDLTVQGSPPQMWEHGTLLYSLPPTHRISLHRELTPELTVVAIVRNGQYTSYWNIFLFVMHLYHVFITPGKKFSPY